MYIHTYGPSIDLSAVQLVLRMSHGGAAAASSNSHERVYSAAG